MNSRTSKVIILVLVVIFCALIAANSYFLITRDTGSRLNDLLNMDLEYNVPTLLSVILLIANGYLIMKSGLINKNKRLKLKLCLFSLLLFYLAVDEWFQIHEGVMDLIRKYTNLDDIFYFPWVVPAFFMLIFLFYFFAPIYRKIPTKLRSGYSKGIYVYLSGSFVFEVIGGFIIKLNYPDSIYGVSVIIEESLEIAGLIIILAFSLSYFKDKLNKPCNLPSISLS